MFNIKWLVISNFLYKVGQNKRNNKFVCVSALQILIK